MAEHQVDIELTESGMGTVEIDGLDISNLVTGLRLHMDPPERQTRLLLELMSINVRVHGKVEYLERLGLETIASDHPQEEEAEESG